MFKVFLFFILFSQIAGASTDVEKKRFYKCYSLFVRQAMPENHALWLQVKSGTLLGTDACMQLLEKAKLGSSGLLSNPQDIEAIKILKRFSEWSRSFVSGSIGSELNSSADVIDVDGAAHYITRSVLKEGAEFRDIVTLNYPLMAKRSSTIVRKYSVIPQFRPYKYNIGATSTYEDFILKFWQGVFPATVSPPPENFFPRLVETGNLLGFVPDQEPIILDQGISNGVFNGSGKAVNQHFGGGAIGSQGYLLGNMPSLNALGDGGLRVHRIFGKNVLENFLCRSAPYLRSQDVVPEVHSESTIAFRSGFSCMGCHAAQDNVAAVARNLTHVATNNMSAGTKYGMRFIADNVSSKMPTEPLPTLAADPNFYKRHPSGRLFYRNYNGDLVNVLLTDLASLGSAIADQEDFYVCGVKRFYQALVGIEVDLSDPGHMNYTDLSAEHKNFREKVVAWGIELKNDQKMLNIIRKIIDSPEFVSLGQEL